MNSPKYKILMLGLVNPEKNDAEKVHFFELANAFSNLGHEIDIIVPKGKLDERLRAGVNLTFLPFKSNNTNLRVFLLNFLLIFYYFFQFKKYNYVYIRWRMLPCIVYKMFNLLFFKDRTIITEHNGWLEKEAQIQHSSSLYSRICRFIQILDARFADKVVVVTEGIKSKLVSCGVSNAKIIVAGNGTNTKHFFPLDHKSKLKRELLNIDETITILGFMGNISKWQGIDTLLEMFEVIGAKYPKSFLLLIGSGIYLDEVKERISKLFSSDRVIIIENVPYEKMNKWMNVMDIAFAPKSFDLDEIGYSPLKIRDYAAAGVPIVSTAVNGIKELEKFGFLKTYTTTNECVTIVEKLLNKPENLVSMSSLGRKYALNEFDWSMIARGIIDKIENFHG